MVKTIDATVTSQGQITIPVEIRRRLGLEKGSRVRFVVDDAATNTVTMMAPRYTLEDVIGSIPGKPGMSIDLDDEIEEAMADELAGRYRWARPE